MKYSIWCQLSNLHVVNGKVLTALIRAEPVSMDPRRVSPILMPTTWAPGATPFLSGSLGKWPAAIQETWVPWEPAKTNTHKFTCHITYL